MTNDYCDGHVSIRIGDAMEQLRLIETESVQTVVTSPPYYGLRDYGVDGQIGLEPTLGEFIAALVSVFSEVHRVLRPDGTLWVNMGDSYVSPGSGSRDETRWPKQTRNTGSTNATSKVGSGLPAKSLMGVPWRLAFALQDAGWILRQDIIWSKPSPMPESVKDRCTKSHEYMFLFSKSPRYYFDAAAIAEPAVTATRFAPVAGWASGPGDHSTIDHNLPGDGGAKYPRKVNAKDFNPSGMRNRRSVWEIRAEANPEAHFATFPEKLVEPCILAGSRPGDVVLDPFVGSGTTVHVAHRLERRAIGIDLNPDYLPLISRPLAQQVLRLENVS